MKKLINLERLKQQLVDEFGATIKVVDNYLQHHIFKTPVNELNEREIRQVVTNANGELKKLFGVYTKTLKDNWRGLFSHRYNVEVSEYHQAFKKELATPKSLIAYADKAFSKPLNLDANVGVSLDELLDSFEKNEADRITRAIRLAHHEGLPHDKLVQMIRGSKANRYADGILNISTRNASAIARTGTAVMASEAKQQFIRDNSDLIKGIRVLATLDSRTSSICRHLDHEFMPIEEAKYPPYHFNCRSSFILVFEGMREPTKRASTNGTVDNVSYYEWLKQQTDEFQDEVLGKTRAKLFRDGGLSVERFKALQLDKNFTSMSLEKMKQLEPTAFDKAFKTALPLNDGSLEENIKRLLPQVKNLVRENSMAFRKQNAVGQKWAVATISDKIQEQLKAQTKEVWLSDDTLIKMMIHHPELNLMPLFTNVQAILDNAIKIVKKDDLNVMYLSKRDKNYVATLKAVKGRDELYLTTIYQVDDKRFKKELEKLEGDH